MSVAAEVIFIAKWEMSGHATTTVMWVHVSTSL